jgi:hypothetical protein
MRATINCDERHRPEGLGKALLQRKSPLTALPIIEWVVKKGGIVIIGVFQHRQSSFTDDWFRGGRQITDWQNRNQNPGCEGVSQVLTEDDAKAKFDLTLRSSGVTTAMAMMERRVISAGRTF